MSRSHENNLQVALKACKGSFLSVGFFSLFVNALMLAPTFYMIQVSGRVVPSSSTSTLIMLTLILTIMMLTLGSLESLQSEVSILTKLVDDLHQLSLSDAGALAYRKVDTDVVHLVQLAEAGSSILSKTGSPSSPCFCKSAEAARHQP